MDKDSRPRSQAELRKLIRDVLRKSGMPDMVFRVLFFSGAASGEPMDYVHFYFQDGPRKVRVKGTYDQILAAIGDATTPAELHTICRERRLLFTTKDRQDEQDNAT